MAGLVSFRLELAARSGSCQQRQVNVAEARSMAAVQPPLDFGASAAHSSTPAPVQAPAPLILGYGVIGGRRARDAYRENLFHSMASLQG